MEQGEHLYFEIDNLLTSGAMPRWRWQREASAGIMLTITVEPAAGFMSLSFGDVLEGGSSPDGQIQSALNDADDAPQPAGDLPDLTVLPPSQPGQEDNQVPVMI